MNKKFSHSWVVETPSSLIDFLVQKENFSKEKIKKVLNLGGVWITAKNKKRPARVRRATKELMAGDKVDLFFDPKLLNINYQGIYPLFEHKHYGVWFKPAGIPSQGTVYGDEGSLLRYLEKQKPQVYLLHRLDRETSGVMLFAYTSEGARTFGQMLQQRKIKKIYRGWVIGDAQKILKDSEGEINQRLDNKEAITKYKILTSGDKSHLELQIITGRTHQIRRHLSMVGLPLIGDRLYGKKGDKNQLALKAIEISFFDPWEKKLKTYSIQSKMG